MTFKANCPIVSSGSQDSELNFPSHTVVQMVLKSTKVKLWQLRESLRTRLYFLALNFVLGTTVINVHSGSPKYLLRFRTPLTEHAKEDTMQEIKTAMSPVCFSQRSFPLIS